MKNLPLLLLSFVLLFAPVQWCAAASHDGGNGKVDIRNVIFGHVKDSYEWHLTTIGDRHVAISLPVIIYSGRTGLEIFSSALFHEQQEYKGFRIASGGVNEGKIVEYDESGNESRPILDLSITKNAFALMLNSLLLVVIVLLTAR
ncbi:MAG: F0F1 ATP synthase subunit A, partial [Bacteroidaceae bacterium]|nr:F0F1 ATP synthase subunit A [Bacteroidaceae bacterium]